MELIFWSSSVGERPLRSSQSLPARAGPAPAQEDQREGADLMRVATLRSHLRSSPRPRSRTDYMSR